MLRNAFIVGSPRSGTTLLGDILDLHPQIGRWYEPYFVLDRYFRNSPNDCRTASDVTDEIKRYIVSAFDYYRRKRGCDICVDKSPRNSLKIPFLREIFPDARFIHLLRDGRDTTLSINREWQKREEILRSRKHVLQAMRTIKNFLVRQPLLVHKVAALHFEVESFSSTFRGHSLLHRLRWNGRIGWGPRFAGWQAIIDQVSTLEFNALQWVKCVEAVLAESQHIEKDQFLEIRYEDFLQQPREMLESVLDFLKVPFPEDFMSRLPTLKRTNYGKWKQDFSDEEKSRIGPILNPLLVQLGYTGGDSWYKQQKN